MAASSKSKEEDLSNVEFETSEEVEVIATFDQMNLREDLLRGIYAYGESGRLCRAFFSYATSHRI